jgi:hypothetical protein
MLTDHGLGNLELDQSIIFLVEPKESVQKLNQNAVLVNVLKINIIDELFLATVASVDS